jgi:hypothetical protein
VKKIYYENDSIAIVGSPLVDFETDDGWSQNYIDN